MTATSCLSTLTRRRRRNKPILESRLSKRIGAGAAEIRASMTCNYLPLAFPLPLRLPLPFTGAFACPWT
jgi:hypothetical protein